MPLTIKDVGVDEEKLREILKEYIVAKKISDEGNLIFDLERTEKLIDEVVSLIKDLPCKIELDEDKVELVLIQQHRDNGFEYRNCDVKPIKQFAQALKSKQEEIVKRKE
jgi:adenine C2-methylase RlmN of 23S rRNA A2503 and tRNA A37